MEFIKFECESITPMFMYGADGKAPELRPASIKGIIRFWWRAINGDSDIESLKDAESKIFGNTDRRSKVTIRVQSKPKRENIIKIEKISKEKNSKLAYLFYPFYLDGADKEKSCFINLKFKVILSSFDKKALKEASFSFILLSLFGGLGSRSRRGGGNFRITAISDEKYHQFLLNNTKKINSIYAQIKRYFLDTYGINQASNEYSTLINLSFQLSSKSRGTWDETLKDIETKYKTFRKRKENKLLSNSSFGLPIKDKEHSVEIFTNPEFERRASPLIIKTLKIQNRYYWLVLKLNGEFLPSGTKIGLDKEKIDSDIDETIVDEFIEGLR